MGVIFSSKKKRYEQEKIKLQKMVDDVIKNEKWIKPPPMKGEPENCCICMDDIEEGKVEKTKCNHTFCKGCIKEWLKNNNTCPLCRTKIKDGREHHIRYINRWLEEERTNIENNERDERIRRDRERNRLYEARMEIEQAERNIRDERRRRDRERDRLYEARMEREQVERNIRDRRSGIFQRLEWRQNRQFNNIHRNPPRQIGGRRHRRM